MVVVLQVVLVREFLGLAREFLGLAPAFLEWEQEFQVLEQEFLELVLVLQALVSLLAWVLLLLEPLWVHQWLLLWCLFRSLVFPMEFLTMKKKQINKSINK